MSRLQDKSLVLTISHFVFVDEKCREINFVIGLDHQFVGLMLNAGPSCKIWSLFISTMNRPLGIWTNSATPGLFGAPPALLARIKPINRDAPRA
jgi:hypothetical protein